eukprot:570106-Prymnesium_polylepis.2
MNWQIPTDSGEDIANHPAILQAGNWKLGCGLTITCSMNWLIEMGRSDRKVALSGLKMAKSNSPVSRSSFHPFSGLLR